MAGAGKPMAKAVRFNRGDPSSSLIETMQQQKFEHNRLSKSLENLEKQIWPALDASEGSYLIRTCHGLRKKQLKNLTVEDLRIMIGQNIGLRFLVPLAIEELRKNTLTEGDFYEGDLLANVLTSDPNYWREYRENWKLVCELVEQDSERLFQKGVHHAIRKHLLESWNLFKAL